MYCTQCGALNEHGGTTCTACGAKLMSAMLSGDPANQFDFGPSSAATGQPYVQVPNYLVQSILATFFCCMPLGIPAIVYAAQVDSKINRGDVAGARESSKNAKLWCGISCGAGIAWVVVCVIFVIVMVATQAPPPRRF